MQSDAEQTASTDGSEAFDCARSAPFSTGTGQRHPLRVVELRLAPSAPAVAHLALSRRAGTALTEASRDTLNLIVRNCRNKRPALHTTVRATFRVKAKPSSITPREDPTSVGTPSKRATILTTPCLCNARQAHLEWISRSGGNARRMFHKSQVIQRSPTTKRSNKAVGWAGPDVFRHLRQWSKTIPMAPVLKRNGQRNMFQVRKPTCRHFTQQVN